MLRQNVSSVAPCGKEMWESGRVRVDGSRTLSHGTLLTLNVLQADRIATRLAIITGSGGSFHATESGIEVNGAKSFVHSAGGTLSIAGMCREASDLCT